MVDRLCAIHNQPTTSSLRAAHPALDVLLAYLDVNPELRCTATIVELGEFVLIELLANEANGGNHPESRSRYSGWYMVEATGAEAEIYIVDDVELVLRRILDHERGCGDRYEVIPQQYIDDVELRFIGGSTASVGVIAARFRLALRTKLESCGWVEPREEPKDSTSSRNVTGTDVGLDSPSPEPVKYADREDIENAYNTASAKHCVRECSNGAECSTCNTDNYIIMGGELLLTIPVKSIHEATAADLICLVNGYYADTPKSKVVNKPDVTFVFCNLHSCFYALPPMPETAHWVEFALEQWQKGSIISNQLRQQLTLSDLIG